MIIIDGLAAELFCVLGRRRKQFSPEGLNTTIEDRRVCIQPDPSQNTDSPQLGLIDHRGLRLPESRRDRFWLQ
jgi:hypothetical protein